jgi:hypothetical protein
MITEEQERVGPSDRIVVGAHEAIGQFGHWTAFGFGFSIPVFNGETGDVVKGRIKERLELTDEAFGRVIVAIGDLYAIRKEDVTTVENDEVIEVQLEKYQKPAFHLIHPEKMKDKKGAVNYRPREIPFQIRN